MRKKIILIIIIVVVVVLLGWRVVADISEKGYAIYGDAWCDTPEEALRQEADMTTEMLQILTPKYMLCTKYIDDIVEMAFVSDRDTLVTVTIVKNEKGKFGFYGYSEEIWLDSPASFLLNGNPEQLNVDSDQSIMFPYNQHNTTVWGWCYSGYSFTVNGITPSKETYVFDCQGKTWSIDYWWVENVVPESDVQIEYISESAKP